jgi:hypothetical protein
VPFASDALCRDSGRGYRLAAMSAARVVAYPRSYPSTYLSNVPLA